MCGRVISEPKLWKAIIAHREQGGIFDDGHVNVEIRWISGYMRLIWWWGRVDLTNRTELNNGVGP